MDAELLHKSNTGISSEFFVAGELARRGFNVTLTFGNTKAIDLLVERNGALIPIQVKGMQRTKSICWNVNLKKLENDSLIFVLVNLHADTLQQPEYFVLTSAEVRQHFKSTESGRDYLDYNLALKLDLKDQWNKILKGIEIEPTQQSSNDESTNLLSSMYWTGYCPESALQGRQVRMRLNSNDFFESEATGLQIAVLSGVQAIIMNFRGSGEFRSTATYADEVENGELLSPQTSDDPPFNNGELFQGSEQIERFLININTVNK